MPPPTTWNVRKSFPNLFMKTFMYGMVGSLAMFITSYEQADRIKDQFLDKNRNYGHTYDFIIVGGGNGGSIMANRLSLNYKVLLLEAGGSPHPFNSIPFMSNFMSNYKEIDWMHTTVPQKHAFFGSINNEARISGGLSLGGTSNFDYMIHLRGSPQDYDNWSQVIKDQSWAYSSILKYFKKHEKYTGPWKNTQMHGEKGEIAFSLPPYTGLGQIFCEGGNEMGYKNVDLNGQFNEGFDIISYGMKRGRRDGVFSAFIKPAQERWNLFVHKYAHVNRILFRGDTNEAYAVEYDRHGKRKLAYAKKEIILSAGAIQSPKILMLSGIGKKEDLESLGIPSRIHLPSVGQNLQDHISVHLGPFFTKPRSSLLLDRDLTGRAIFDYTIGLGPLTSTGYEAAAMLTSDQTKINGNPYWPDIQLTLHGMSHHESSDEDFCHSHRMRRGVMTKYLKHSKGRDSFSIIVSAGRPKSRGQVTLKDSNPYSPPVIDPKYLQEIQDVQVLIDGIKKSMRLVENTLSFQQIGSNFTTESVPGCTQYRFRSDDYWSCYIRLMSISMGDISGTAAMGSVVTPQLNVIGTSRLRVVDASIMPFIVGSSTGAATMMIGEKGAAMVLDYWGSPDPKEETKNLLKEREHIREILKASSNKLNSMDTSSLFLNNIKNSESFKELTSDDVKDVLGLANSGGNIDPGTLGQILSSETSKGYPSTSNFNSFKLIGAMLRNSLNPKEPLPLNLLKSNNENETNNLSIPLHVNMQNLHPSYRIPYRSVAQQGVLPRNTKISPYPNIPTTTLRTRLKSPSVDTLFDPSTTTSSYITYNNYPINEVLPGLSFKPLPRPGQDPTETFTLKPQPITQYFDNKIWVSAQIMKPVSTAAPYVSLNEAVGSIISKTLPIVANQPQQPPNYYPFVTPPPSQAPPRGQSFIYLNREEMSHGLRGHVDIILKLQRSLPQPPNSNRMPLPSVAASTLRKVQNIPSPFEIVRTPIRMATAPIRKVSQPLSKMVITPLDGFLKNIRSILKPSIQVSDPGSPLFPPILPDPILTSLKDNSGSLGFEVQNRLATKSDGTPSWTGPPPVILLSTSTFKTSLDRFTSKLLAKSNKTNPFSIGTRVALLSQPVTPQLKPVSPLVHSSSNVTLGSKVEGPIGGKISQNNYPYAPQETSTNNTFKYPTTNHTYVDENFDKIRPPTDYEIMDWESDSTKKSLNRTIPFLEEIIEIRPSLSFTTPSSLIKQNIAKDNKIIYERPLENNKKPASATKLENLGKFRQYFEWNVEELLGNVTKSKPTSFTAKNTRNEEFQYFYMKEDLKNVREEVKKLLSDNENVKTPNYNLLANKNLKNLENVEHIIVDSNISNSPFGQVLSRNNNLKSNNKLSLSKSVYEILGDPIIKKEMNKNTGLIINSNLLGFSEINRDNLKKLMMGGINKESLNVMDFTKSSLTSPPNRLPIPNKLSDTISFRIKILNK